MKAAEPWPHLRVLFAVALESGCRIGEQLKLQWRHVDRTRGTIMLVNTNTKTSKARTFPMTAQVRAIVEHRRHAPDGTEHGRTLPVRQRSRREDRQKRVEGRPRGGEGHEPEI